MRKKFLPVFLCCILIGLTLSGCTASAKRQSKISDSGFYFHTIITITLYDTTDSGYIEECFRLAEHYEKLLSNTVADSEISQINALAGTGTYLEVSSETLEVLQAAIDYGKLSDGRFDVTIGNLSALWDFSNISANLQTDNNEADASILPNADDIAAALSHVDYNSIDIRDNTVALLDADASIDLGGIAKGYIADKMKTYLNGQGITSGIINLGGNILTLGPKSDGSDYAIGIQKPFGESGETIGACYVADRSIVTSGVYERYYRVDGTLYHHILDTATGYPCDNNLYEVTIISSSSMAGDALSTACFSLGLENGLSLIESLDETEAIFVTSDNQIYTSSGIGDTVRFVRE